MIDTCATCAHWHRGAPPLATATRRAYGSDDVGTCQLYAPNIIARAGIDMTLFPQTHADRTCGDWTPSGPHDPNGGEEVGNVVPLRDVA